MDHLFVSTQVLKDPATGGPSLAIPTYNVIFFQWMLTEQKA